MSTRRLLTSLGICLATAACETPRPQNDVQPNDAAQDVAMDVPSATDVTQSETSVEDAAPEASASDAADASDASDAADADAADVTPPPACMPAATDFQPRLPMAMWVAPYNTCTSVTNPNTYPLFSMSAAAPGRVTALGALEGAGNFFDPTRDPAPGEFRAMGDAGAVNAAGLFMANGIETRFLRRADERYAVPTVDGMGTPLALNSSYQDFCGVSAQAAANMDYCTGPNALNPVYQAAISAGASGMPAGTPSRVHAARIQAAYQWWLFISSHKESLTCAPVNADCDSAAGYYTGTAGRNDATQYGLARELIALGDVGRDAHNRIWDSLLAVRCWRELDGAATLPAMPAMNEMLRERARLQQDRALTRGMALILQARLRAFASTDGTPARAAERQAHAAWIGVTGPLFANGLERWSRGWWASQRASASMGVVTRLATELRAGEMISTAQAGRAAADIEALFPCP